MQKSQQMGSLQSPKEAGLQSTLQIALLKVPEFFLSQWTYADIWTNCKITLDNSKSCDMAPFDR